MGIITHNTLVKRTKIVDALAKTVFGEAIDVKGWVRTHRSVSYTHLRAHERRLYNKEHTDCS